MTKRKRIYLISGGFICALSVLAIILYVKQEKITMPVNTYLGDGLSIYVLACSEDIIDRNRLYQLLTMADYEEAEVLLKAALQDRGAVMTPQDELGILNDVGVSYTISGRLDQALDVFKRAENLAKDMDFIKDKKLLANLYNNIGILYFQYNFSEEAIENYKTAQSYNSNGQGSDAFVKLTIQLNLLQIEKFANLSGCEDINRYINKIKAIIRKEKWIQGYNQLIGATAYIFLGDLYRLENNKTQVEECVNKVQTIIYGNEDNYQLLNLQARKLPIMMDVETQDYAAAIIEIEKSMSIAENYAGKESGILADLYQLKGIIYLRTDELEEGLKYFSKALSIYKSERERSACLLNLGIIYYKISDYEEAEDNLLKAYKIMKAENIPYRSSCINWLTKIHQAEGSKEGFFTWLDRKMNLMEE